jgi:hypothetical protein
MMMRWYQIKMSIDRRNEHTGRGRREGENERIWGEGKQKEPRAMVMAAVLVVSTNLKHLSCAEDMVERTTPGCSLP